MEISIVVISASAAEDRRNGLPVADKPRQVGAKLRMPQGKRQSVQTEKLMGMRSGVYAR